MRIFINDIFTSSKSKFTYKVEFEQESCKVDGRTVKFNQKPSMVCEISKTEDNKLYASIDVHLETRLNCVRCLGDMDAIQDINISGIISREDNYQDYDIILIDGDYLDLEKILDEAIFEHLIDNTYCKEDCKGLCHICGTNLNISKCNCDEEHLYIDPRLEQLKTFLDD